jgi:hypothetical protein
MTLSITIVSKMTPILIAVIIATLSITPGKTALSIMTVSIND